MTPRETLTFWAALRGLRLPRSAPALDAALAAFALDPIADWPCRWLSAGQRRRVALARLLVAPAPLWLLDEPTSALDDDSQARLERGDRRAPRRRRHGDAGDPHADRARRRREPRRSTDSRRAPAILTPTPTPQADDAGVYRPLSPRPAAGVASGRRDRSRRSPFLCSPSCCFRSGSAPRQKCWADRAPASCGSPRCSPRCCRSTGCFCRITRMAVSS